MRWIAPLTLVCLATFLTAAFGVMIGEPVAASVVGLISLAAWLGVGFLACPRCGLHIGRRKLGGVFMPSPESHPDQCVRCGRTRTDVYPFQRMLAPESLPPQGDV